MMPRGPRTVAVTFGARSLTHYGGVYLLHRFLARIGFKHAVALQVRVAQRNHRYSIGEMLFSLLYPMILGLERIETPAVAAAERRVPVPDRAAELPGRQHPASLPAARGPDGPAQGARLARPFSAPDDGPAPASAAAHLRCGLHRVGRLRTAGAGPDRVQPDQAGAAVVSPVALLRRSEQRLLARRVAAGRCAYRQWDARPPHGLLRQDAARDPIADRPRRQRVLRPQADRVARGAADPLRDRGSTDGPDQNASSHTCGTSARVSASRLRSSGTSPLVGPSPIVSWSSAGRSPRSRPRN